MFCTSCGSSKVEAFNLCASCAALHRKADRMKLKEKKPIKKVSDKLADRLKQYVIIKAKWLPGKMCCVFPDKIAIECHHSAGRSHNGYYDEWAEQNDIPLLLDVRWWKPVSREGHMKIENFPEWAKENGYSESRI